MLEQNHNLILVIFELCTKIIDLEFWHVYGHKDVKKRTVDKWEILNCEYDLRTKFLMSTLTTLLPRTQHRLYWLFWRISIDDRLINDDIGKLIYCHIHNQDLLKHIAKRNKVTLTTFSTVNWPEVGCNAKKNSDTKHVKLVKFCGRFIGTSNNMKRRKD